MNKNPFIVYGYEGEDFFCGRAEECSRLVSALRNGRNVTFVSPRRIGKTGLVKRAFDVIKKQHPDALCFYVNIFTTTCLADFVMLLGKVVLRQLETPLDKIVSFFRRAKVVVAPDVMTGVPQASLEFSASDASASLDEVFACLKGCGRECFVAIDEFQQVATYPETTVGGLVAQSYPVCP